MLVIGVHHFAQKKHGNEVTMKRFIITGIILLFTLTTIVFLHPAKPQHESIDNTTNSYEYYYNEKKDEEEEDSLLPEDLDSILAENPTAPLDLVPSSITVLVNRTYLLPSSYTPANLVIPDVKFSFSYISDKRKLRKVAANALEKLFEAAEKEDIELYGVSGYRSYARQKEIYDRNIAVRGQAATDAVSAKPGSSEHQTGLTIDVSSKSVNYRLDQSFGDTKEGKWLADHAHLYGFIIRYPYGKSDITGYSYEPWHIRFVGTTVATYLFEKNITLEEYYGAQSADDAPENAVDVEDPDSVKWIRPPTHKNQKVRLLFRTIRQNRLKNRQPLLRIHQYRRRRLRLHRHRRPYRNNRPKKVIQIWITILHNKKGRHMRTILMLLLYLFVCIISIPLLLIECIVRKVNKRAAAAFALTVVRIAFNLGMFVSGCKKEIVGTENIPRDTPVVFAANHRSFYDIILAYQTIASAHVQVAFISKIEIKKTPAIAQWMYFLNCLFMDRGDMKQNMGVILDAIALVKDGYSIYIAPEGTRNATDTLLPFKEGSMKIATKTNAPIVPVCIRNTENILESHLPWVRGGKVYIEFGKPVYIDTLEKEEKKHIGAHIQHIVQDMYDSSEQKCG